MGVLIMGLSHKTAPIELREQLTVPAHRLAEALDKLRSNEQLKEAVIISTCNRLEVYARPASDFKKSHQALFEFFQVRSFFTSCLNSTSKVDYFLFSSSAMTNNSFFTFGSAFPLVAQATCPMRYCKTATL